MIDTNVFSEIFEGNMPVKQYVENIKAGVDTTIYVECLQGQKSNNEKQRIKKYLANLPILHFIPSRREKVRINSPRINADKRRFLLDLSASSAFICGKN